MTNSVQPPPEGVTRRRFIQTAGLASTAAFLAACGVSDSGSASSTTAGGAAAATTGAPGTTSAPGISGAIYSDLYPTLPRGGSLVVGTTEQVPNTLDVLRNSLGATGWNAAPAQDFLEHYDHNSILVPSLTESVEVVDDATLRYTLHDAKFHTGAQVTSQSVQDIFEWIQDPDNASVLASRIEGVTIVPEDERTFLFQMPGPDATIRAHLPRIPIMPVEFAGEGEQSVGAGPFIFEEWERDSHVLYRSNPDYWDPAAPRVDSLRIRHFPDSTSGTQTFLAGDMDYLYPAAFPQFADLQARADAGEFNLNVTEPGVCYLVANCVRPPFDNPKVRQAMMYALDRPAMAQAGFAGAGREFLFPLAPEHPFYPADLSITRDVEKAKSLMAEAGLSGGLDAVVISPDFSYFQAIATISQANLAEIGINVELEILDISTLIDRAIQQRDFDITVLGTALDPELGAVLNPRFTTDATNNYWGYSNPVVDDILVRAKSTFVEEERKALYHEFFEVAIMQDAAFLSVTNEPLINIYRNTTNGGDYRPDPLAIWHWPIAATGL